MRSLFIHLFVLWGTLIPALASAAVTPMVAAGRYHTVALKADGTVLAWGNNVQGQLGDGTTTTQLSPVAVPGLTGVVAVAAATGDGNHTLALKAGGTVLAWGNNAQGQLGDGTTTNRLSPVAVPGVTGVVAIAAGSQHTVALKADGTVLEWGGNTQGQLGDGTSTNRSTPVAVPGLTGVVAVAAGYYHTLALKADGTVMSWGLNNCGQLGDGTVTNRLSPAPVPGLSGVVAMAAGDVHTVVLKGDGTVLTWGYNAYGELGDRTTATRLTPVTVPGLAGVVAVAADYYYSLALKSDGTVAAWGINDSGQLGNGTTNNRDSAAVVPGLTAVLAVASGRNHAAALKSDGTVLTWGNNSYGQLGDGTRTARLNPAVMPGGLFASQTVSFGTVPNIVVAGTGMVSATASSGLSVSFTSNTPLVCSVSGSTVTGIATGTCTIAATQAGDTVYNAATETQSITIDKAGQTVSFGSAPAIAVGGTGTVSATASSGLAVSFSSATPGACTVSGSTVTGITLGTCTIVANQAGDANYNGATQAQSITIKKGQTVSFAGAPSIVVAGTGTVSATATSGLAVSFSSATPNFCTVSGSTVTGVSAGTCTVVASQEGDANYNGATQTQSITVRNGQTVSFAAAPVIDVAGTGAVSATATSGLPVSFSSVTPSVCTVSGNVVTGVSVGFCTIVADQAGDASYNGATQTQSITIRNGQTVSFRAAPAVVVAGTGTVSATATSGLAVSFSSVTPLVCTVSGSTVTGIRADTCTIAADQAGDADYRSATQMQSIVIGKAGQSVSFGAAPTVTVGGTGAVSATTTSGLAVSFTSTTPSVCSVSAGTITGLTAGTCTIAADQTGNADYNAAIRATQSFPVKQNQTIAIGTAPVILEGGKGSILATATSGLAVVITSITPGVCVAAGNDVLIPTAGGRNWIVPSDTIVDFTSGTCTLKFTQDGDATYSAAPQVTLSIAIGKGSQTVTFGAAPTIIVPGTGAVSATASSGLPVSFTSMTPAVCTVSDSAVTGIAIGTCTIAADQAGGIYYNAAAQVTQSFPITAAPVFYSLAGNITGSGSINNVQQDSPSFSCASPSTECTVTSLAGTAFTLYATPSALFDFAGWSGAGCGAGACQLVLDGNTTVTATFIPKTLLQRVGCATAYMSFSAAYGDATGGSEIRSRDAAINGDVHLDRDISVKLNGGYAAGFTTVSAFTTINGKLSIGKGRVTVSHIKIGLPATSDFTLMPPGAVATAQGASGTSTISTTVDGGFNAAVALTASGVPTGATATFSPASILAPGAGSTTLTLIAGPATPPGSYTITVSGTGGGSTHITTLLMTVTAAVPDFTVTAPASVAAVQGGAGTATISTGVSGGFDQAVALSASGVPPGATATFSPASIAAPGSGSAILTLTAGAATPAGSYAITVTGTGGGTTHGETVSFTVAPAQTAPGGTQMGGALQGTPLALTSVVTTFAGGHGTTSLTGLDGIGTAAEFHYPWGITTDGNNLYVTDYESNKIRKIVIATKEVTTLAGPDTATCTAAPYSSCPSGSTDATGTAARFYGPSGITTDGVNLYVADDHNSAIRKIAIATGAVTTLAGPVIGVDSISGGPVSFSRPKGITTDGTNVYVSDGARIYKIGIASRAITTLAGSGTGLTGTWSWRAVDRWGGVGTSPYFNGPMSLTTDGVNLFVLDSGNNRICKVVIATGVVTVVAGWDGTGTRVAGSADGTGGTASFNNPIGITSDGTNLYVADYGNDTIRKIVIGSGVVTTVAGPGPGTVSTIDGTGTAATFRYPSGITTDGGSLYVADRTLYSIRRIQ